MGEAIRSRVPRGLIMRTTFLDAKNSRLPAVVNVSPEDDRFRQYLNEACQRLVQTGEKFHGLYGEFAFCVDQDCVTLPRQIANVEAVAVCGRPLTIRGSWFQFLQSGPGVSSGSSCTGSSWGCGISFQQKAGDFCTYRDILGTNKKIRVYCDVAEDADAVITLSGYDESGNWIRTQVGGVWIDGEQVALNSVTPQLTTKLFTSLVSVQKPQTNGSVRLYEYDTTLLTQRDIAVYEPDETNPAYRRVEIRGLSGTSGCCGSTDEDCTEAKVTVMAKLEFIPVARDEDWLLIGNLPALKDELQAILKSENNLFEESLAWHMKAVNALRAELRHYVGSGVVQPIKMQPRNVGGAAVANMI